MESKKSDMIMKGYDKAYGMPVGKFNGDYVYTNRLSLNRYEYVILDNKRNAKKVDGRKIKKFNKDDVINLPYYRKKETPKPVKKATPKPVIKNPLSLKTLAVLNNTDEDFEKKRKERYANLDKRDKALKEYKDQQIKKGRSFKNEFIAINNEFDKIWAKKKRDERKAKATPKPVIKNEVIEKKEEPPVKQAKKTTPKQPKQTEEQLAKRRAKYQENKAKELARKKAYRDANKEKINEYQEQYRASAKGKAYQKAYREENKKIPEPKRTKAEVEAGVKAFGLPKGKERYAVDINKKIKENKPRKVRTDKGKERGKYNRPTKEENIKKYPRPVRKSGESEEVYNVRRGLWEKVVGGRLPPSMLTMKNAVKVAYGDGITIGGKDMTTSEWIRKIEKETGRDIERDGLGVGNLKKADIDPDAVY